MSRIAPVPFERWDEPTRAALLGFLRRRELYEGPDARPLPNVLGLLANHGPLAASWLSFSDILLARTSLAPRLRELIILRVAWRTRSAYEWLQHTRMGLDAGLSVAELHAVPAGGRADVWSDLERSLLDAVDQLVDRHTVDDGTWAVLSTHFDPSQLVEVLFTAGGYLCFAVVANASGLQPDASAEIVDAPALPSP
ncbi:MAG TPA: carboxymuconolactone decarboxylase family protein [Acidimicrobiales bacterium]|nr:carboxymuconolactone decarboxylase family protein [Acidimicrobiales bacterium]